MKHLKYLLIGIILIVVSLCLGGLIATLIYLIIELLKGRFLTMLGIGFICFIAYIAGRSYYFDVIKKD
jgi:uncharacterized membrane protein YccF (DUF307 family)